MKYFIEYKNNKIYEVTHLNCKPCNFCKKMKMSSNVNLPSIFSNLKDEEYLSLSKRILINHPNAYFIGSERKFKLNYIIKIWKEE